MALPIQPIYFKIGPNWPKLPEFDFFLIAMGANYSSYVKSIPTYAPTFFVYIISF